MELIVGLCMAITMTALVMQAQMDDNDEYNDLL